MGLPQNWGRRQLCARLGVYSMPGSERVAWIVRLVKTDAEGETCCSDVMVFKRPNGLHTMAELGLTLAEAKQLLAASSNRLLPNRPRITPHMCRPARIVAAPAASRTIGHVLWRRCSVKS